MELLEEILSDENLDKAIQQVVKNGTDRMLQQAISQILAPIYKEQFSETSYGFRPMRSAHMAIEKALEYMNKYRKWRVDINLEKFFDKVNRDKREYKESVIGIPQVGNLSPLLGTSY